MIGLLVARSHRLWLSRKCFSRVYKWDFMTLVFFFLVSMKSHSLLTPPRKISLWDDMEVPSEGQVFTGWVCDRLPLWLSVATSWKKDPALATRAIESVISWFLTAWSLMVSRGRERDEDENWLSKRFHRSRERKQVHKKKTSGESKVMIS